ncbi:hypothetical protein EDB80DRAFT_692742 [Ilyonectria destructans]|nr:hypothetical protein EDB80DRAFT_692742 [Ilyonectria destructans]
MQHIGDAWRANPVLCLLIMLVAKPTWLGKLKPRDNFAEFRGWWSEIQDSDEGSISGLEQVVEQKGLAGYLANDGGGRAECFPSTPMADDRIVYADMEKICVGQNVSEQVDYDYGEMVGGEVEGFDVYNLIDA